jgi:hypothetical protein
MQPKLKREKLLRVREVVETQLKNAETSTRAASVFANNPDVKKMMDLLSPDDPIYSAVLTNQIVVASLVEPQYALGFGVTAFASIAPRDGLERLLVVQMIGCHNLAMAFMARAASKDQPSEVLDKNVSRAARCMDLFLRQTEGLKSYRSKGEQKVQVEHVHVNASAQAVVGCLNTESKNS